MARAIFCIAGVPGSNFKIRPTRISAYPMPTNAEPNTVQRAIFSKREYEAIKVSFKLKPAAGEGPSFIK